MKNYHILAGIAFFAAGASAFYLDSDKSETNSNKNNITTLSANYAKSPTTPFSDRCAASSGCGVNTAAVAQSSSELYDYLVQDVCVDSSNNVISGDPLSCSVHRNINIGEPSPYIVTDFDKSNNNMTYSATNSIPVQGADGNTKVLISKSLAQNFNPGFAFSFQEYRDGYDLIDISNSSYASYVRTSDGGCYDQIWSRTGSAANMASRAGGWILFPYANAPSAWPSSSSVNVKTYHVQLTPNRPGCTNGSSTGVTYWNNPNPFRFETNKVMTAIRSVHFASTQLGQSNNAMEKYYYTKEYGYTRWEAWIPQSRCFSERGSSAAACHPESSSYPLNGRCSVLNTNSSPYPGLDTFGNQNWVMVDCRDQTNYISLSNPQIMLDDQMAQINGIVDIRR